jgi:hypothetical protein
MRLVIDAQLVAGYFREVEKNEEPFYSGPVKDLMRRLGVSDLAYVDDDGLIEQEYRDLVETEWFEAWFGERLEVGDILILSGDASLALMRVLYTKFGFPKNSKDRHYVALARAIVQGGVEEAAIVTEDLDFYDPKAKAGTARNRRRLIASQSGPVAKHLAKAESIRIRSVAGQLAT